MDIEIRYENGSMTVHLDEFMTCRSISKVRELVKIIRKSSTPECENAIREYIEQEIEQFEPKQKENAKYIVGLYRKGEILSKADRQQRPKPKQVQAEY